ncbi:MAG: transglutaminase-like domain-containing protein [Leptospiraceae bacterium]|nr:transglutaminase-like domain-containing protein [Leptospiraceae bacterium]
MDYESESVKNFLQPIEVGSKSDIEIAIETYYHVRDSITYDPYHIIFKKEFLKASSIVDRGYGYCVEKAVLLVACIRSFGIEARLGFANVRNHLNSKRLSDLMQSDVFVFHGYAEIFLEGKWVKCTPAFNKKLCEKAGIFPLEFNGKENSLFHPFSKKGDKHMEYLYDYGTFPELPYDYMMDEYAKYYPHLNVRENGTFGEQAKLKNIHFHNEIV